MTDRTNDVNALIDCQAMGIVFVDNPFVQYYQLEQKAFQQSTEIMVTCRRPIRLGPTTNMAKAHLGIQSHQEQLPVLATKVRHYLIVVG